MSSVAVATLAAVSFVLGTETRTMDVELADLVGDQDLELVRAVEGGPNQLLIQTEDGWQPSDMVLFQEDASDSEDIAISDLDGDGRLDVVFANEDTLEQQLYFNRGEDGFVPAFERLGFLARSNTVIAADLDDDGDDDLVFGDSGPAIILINDGQGYFDIQREVHPNNPHAIQDIEAGDVDGDGDLDLVIASEGPNRLLINNGLGEFVASPDAFGQLPDLEETREVDLGDLDGDGDLDVYFANVGFRSQSPTGAADRVLLNNGEGKFSALKDALPLRTAHSLDIDFHDIDSDGDLDGIIGASFGGGVWTLINDGTGKFTEGAFLAGPQVDAVDVEMLPDGQSVYAAGFRSPDAILPVQPSE